VTTPAVRPRSASAAVHVLQAGYAREESDGEHVGSTVTLIQDGPATIIVDPGMVASRHGLLTALAGHGVDPESVTDVVLSHHHPDHTVNAALFPRARIHDHWAVYDGDLWISRNAEGTEISPSVRLLATPGHTREDITTLAATPDTLYACTHAWWAAEGPADDPFAPDAATLAASRARILAVAGVIIPGHGPAFIPDGRTPR
jgi:glyoxylase-like metal-dependent hydrolase (beta-lactamase superfamily II)